MLCKKLLLSLLLTLLATAPVAAETLKIGLNYPQTGRYKDQGCLLYTSPSPRD